MRKQFLILILLIMSGSLIAQEKVNYLNESEDAFHNRMKWFKDEAEEVIFSVEDNGKGIPKEMQQSIFDRFFQVNEQNKEKGDGIGLSFVKHLVELHKGKITVESEPGVESVFKLQSC